MVIPSVSWSVSCEHFQISTILVSLDRSIRRPQVVICFLKAMTNSFQTSITHLLSFVSLFCKVDFSFNRMKTFLVPKLPGRRKTKFLLDLSGERTFFTFACLFFAFVCLILYVFLFASVCFFVCLLVFYQAAWSEDDQVVS